MELSMITDLFEALTIFCFGLSWPISIRKSLISRTAKGKSLFFEFFLWVGYIFGITRKFLLWGAATAPLDWIFYLGWFFYCLNFVMVFADLMLYIRNRRLDAQTQRK